MEITHHGQFLFTVNTGSARSPAAVTPNGTLTLLGSTPVAATGGVGAVDARLSPDGHFLYVDESRIGKVGAFAVNGGNLTELGTSPFALPAGATPGASSSADPHQEDRSRGQVPPRLRSHGGPTPLSLRGAAH